MPNAKLHALYVGWAMHHLLAINRSIDELDGFSNINMLDITSAMRAERAKLINEDEAYRDAAAKLMAGEEPPPYHEENVWRKGESVFPESIIIDPLNRTSQELEDTDYSQIEARIIAHMLTMPGVEGARIISPDETEDDTLEEAYQIAGQLINDHGLGEDPNATRLLDVLAGIPELTDEVSGPYSVDELFDLFGLTRNHALLPLKRIRASLPVGFEATKEVIGAAFAQAMTELKVTAEELGATGDNIALDRWNAVVARALGIMRATDAADSPTHYVHRNAGGSIFVKEADFFKDQGGLIENWGKAWRSVIATSDDHARQIATDMVWDKPAEKVDDFLERAGAYAEVWAIEWFRIYDQLPDDQVNVKWMIDWFANAFQAQLRRDMQKDSEPFQAGYQAGLHDMRFENAAAQSAHREATKRLGQLKDVTAIAITPGNAYADEYMRGMANGLILAQATMLGEEPQYLEAPPATAQSAMGMEHFLDAIRGKGLNIRPNRISPRLDAALRAWLKAKAKIKLTNVAGELREAAIEHYAGIPLSGTVTGRTASYPEPQSLKHILMRDKTDDYEERQDEKRGPERSNGSLTPRSVDRGDGRSVPTTPAKRMSELPALEEAMRRWHGEMFWDHEKLPDGTPRMGKHETEELHRAVGRYLGLKS